MTYIDGILVYRRNLPHIQPPGATYFVTFRLAGSIPAEVVQELQEASRREAAELTNAQSSPDRGSREYVVERRSFARWDTELDLGHGPHWLNNPEIARLVVDSVQHFANVRYELHAFCIMPNHVHLVLTPLPLAEGAGYVLGRILHSLKSYTALRANRILGRSGTFWQVESYDHYVRSDAERVRIIRYVANNPAKAGLVDDWRAWPWTYCRDEL